MFNIMIPWDELGSSNASIKARPKKSSIFFVSEGSIDATEEALYRSLLDHTIYEKDVRPCIHHSQPTNVTFGFLLNQIVEMVSKEKRSKFVEGVIVFFYPFLVHECFGS